MILRNKNSVKQTKPSFSLTNIEFQNKVIGFFKGQNLVIFMKKTIFTQLF